MSKALKIVGAVIAVIAITVATTGIGTAPALSVTLPSTGAVIGIGAATGAGLLGVSAGVLAAVGAGVSLVGGLLAKKPSSSAIGSSTNWKSDVGASIPYWIGRTLNAGNIVLPPRALCSGHR